MQTAAKMCNIFLLLLLPLSAAEWTVTPGTDCSPGEGGEAIGEDSDTTSISLSKCLAACEEDKTCVAVVRRAQDEAGPCYMRSNINLVLCVADKELEVHMLNRDSLQPSLSALEAQQVASGLEEDGKKTTEEEDLPSGKIASSAPVLAGKTSTSQQRSTAWEQHRGTDCYEGKGGQPLSPDPYHSSLTLAQCQAACAQDSTCGGGSSWPTVLKILLGTCSSRKRALQEGKVGRRRQAWTAMQAEVVFLSSLIHSPPNLPLLTVVLPAILVLPVRAL
jgi:hypothetical protein